MHFDQSCTGKKYLIDILNNDTQVLFTQNSLYENMVITVEMWLFV